LGFYVSINSNLKRLSGESIADVRYYLQCIIKLPPACEPSYGAEALGIDLNVDHLAIGITDRIGNPCESFTLAFRPYEALS
jgi:hypothetical protein